MFFGEMHDLFDTYLYTVRTFPGDTYKSCTSKISRSVTLSLRVVHYPVSIILLHTLMLLRVPRGHYYCTVNIWIGFL